MRRLGMLALLAFVAGCSIAATHRHRWRDGASFVCTATTAVKLDGIGVAVPIVIGGVISGAVALSTQSQTHATNFAPRVGGLAVVLPVASGILVSSPYALSATYGLLMRHCPSQIEIDTELEASLARERRWTAEGRALARIRVRNRAIGLMREAERFAYETTARA